MSRWLHVPRGRRLAVAAAIAVLVLAGLGVTAYATGNTVFYGCYDPYLRAIGNVGLGSASRCPAWETPVSWSQTGPAGPSGPSGPTGATGPSGPIGPQGPGGSSAYGYVYESTTTATTLGPRGECSVQ